MPSNKASSSILPPAVPPDRLFVNSVEAAEILGIDERTVRRAIAVGDIPGLRVGRAFRVPTAFLRQAAGQGGSDAPAAKEAS